MTDDQRRAYLKFVRTHHPDRGGDHATFVEGLAAHRRRSHSIADDDPRLDGPLHIVHRRRGLRRLLEILRAFRQSPPPPRVR